MSKKTPLETLKKAQEEALLQGGEKKIQRQHQKGRLTARERITYLCDKNSFYEKGMLARSERSEAQEKTPADGKVCGFGQVAGQSVGISADDATVLAGAGGIIGYEKEFQTHLQAQKKGYPSIHLGDGGGARIPDIMGATGMMRFTYDVNHEARDRKSPLITAIMGECYGGPTWKASVSDIVVQVKGSIMAVTGPPVLSAATGEQVAPETLGGWKVHAEKTGLVDFFAENDQKALALIRKILQYLPANWQESPPVFSDFKLPQFKQENLLDILPEDSRVAYDMHDILEMIFDKQSLLELKPYYDGSLITAFGRIGGSVLGILANNPKVNAGAMGPGACEKASSFISLCDSYHLPLCFIHDTPGFYVSKAAEERQMPTKIMNFIKAIEHCTVPRISLIIRKSYGMAHCNMLGANMGADFLLAWPQADISFMAPEVALQVVMGRRLKEADNPEALRAAFLEEMKQMNAPWEAARRNLIDRIIDPRDTRKELMMALQLASGSKKDGGRSKRKMASWPKMF